MSVNSGVENYRLLHVLQPTAAATLINAHISPFDQWEPLNFGLWVLLYDSSGL